VIGPADDLAGGRRGSRPSKQRTSGGIVTFGSRITWNAGLVVELTLVVGAKALGEGTPIFTQPVEGFSVAEVRHFGGSDNVLLRYAPIG
jgi:hypothetical protein